MRVRVTVFLVLFLLVPSAVSAKEPSWLRKMKQVKLLVDDYEAVIKIFGKPVDNSTERELSEYFDFPEGRIWVGFASGRCIETPYSDGKTIGWKVPEYTVIEIGFSPDEWIEPKTIGIRLEGFRAAKVDDDPGAIEYVNDELGIDYILNHGKVQNVTFRPTKKQEYLLCTSS
jgi:hypothetical protein